jgi:ABC-type multidrug transport system fused ATPase/permease subunit
MGIILPYLIAEFLFYVNNILVSHNFPKIELEIVREITDQTIESMKTSKKQINTNEYIMNLKKVIESKGFYFLIVSHIVPTILVAIGVTYNFMKNDYKTGLLVLLIFLIFGYVSYKFEHNCIESSVQTEKNLNIFYDEIQDVVANIDTVITANSKEKELNNISNEMTNVYKKYSQSEISSSETVYKLHISSLIIAIIICGIAIKMYMNNPNDIDKTLLVSTCIMSILFMQYYNSAINKMKYTVHYFGKFRDIGKYFSEFKLDEELNKQKLIIIDGNIKFDDVSLIYPERTIFSNLSFNIEGQRKTGIIGEIGSGKTSILKMILGLIKYTGKIFIDNQDISKCSQESIIVQIAYIPQHPKIFNKTIYYNISYGTDYTKQDIMNFINKINFKEFDNIFPTGLDTRVGKEGSKLSGGQKQIIALIRALIQDKKILLIDEPTSSLDKNTKIIILNLIQNIRNKTVVVVTHDSDVKQIVDQVIDLNS